MCSPIIQHYSRNFGQKTLKEGASWKTLRVWDHNVKMNLKEIRFECVDSIRIFEDMVPWRALVNIVINLRNP